MPALRAEYTSPTNTTSLQTFSLPLPAISSTPSTQDRVAYLANLQSKVKSLQGGVNTLLTQQMEEDKAAGAGKVDDAKEEENYGEEVVEGD